MVRRKTKVSPEGAKVYAYTRVSTLLQVDRYSLDAQMTSIEKHAQRFNMEIVKTYSDKGKSGKNVADRPAFLEMIEDIKKGEDGVTFVLVYKLSRFGRKTSEALQYMELMRDHGVYLICVEDNIDTSSEMGAFMLTVLALVAEMERENILMQTMDGRRQKAREGKWNGGVTPFGYQAEGETLVPSYPDAHTVKLIFEKWVSTPMPQATLANWLNANGYRKEKLRPRERNKFTPRFITRMLRNPVYMGMIAYGKTTVDPTSDNPNRRVKVDFSEYDIKEDACPALVTKELWYQAQAKLDAQSGKVEKREKDHEYLLAALLRCPKCGKPMYGRPAKGKKKNANGEEYPPYYSYVCSSYARYSDRCGFGQIACHKIDSQVRNILMSLTTAENFAETMALLANEFVDTSEVEAQLEVLRKRLRDLAFNRDYISSKQTALKFDDPNYVEKDMLYESQLSSIFEAIRETENSIAEQESILRGVKEQILTKDEIYKALSVFYKVYDSMSDFEKKNFLKTFIEKIELYPEKSRKHGCYIKSIDFLFPVSFKGNKVYQIEYEFGESGTVDASQQSKPHVETCVLLCRENIDSYIPIHLDVEKLGEIPNVPVKEETFNKKKTTAKLQTFGTATYAEIKEYCLERHGFNIHTQHIAELKRELGISERKCYYKGKEGTQTRPNPVSDERREAILDAFKYFGMI